MIDLHPGDCLEVLRTLQPKSVQLVVTSPPYYHLRDYGSPLGQETTPEAYVENLVEIFRLIHRVLRDDGAVYLNLGDTYRRKQLLGIPHRVVFALQAAGWYWRNANVWAKTNPLPDGAQDRCSSSHEYVFMLTKCSRYFYDADAIREEPTGRTDPIRGFGHAKERHDNGRSFALDGKKGGNCRDVWRFATATFREGHYATMPLPIAERCILAGSRVGDTVLDPFAGVGTTGLVADRARRNALLIERNPDYCEIIRQRCGLVDWIKAAAD